MTHPFPMATSPGHFRKKESDSSLPVTFARFPLAAPPRDVPAASVFQGRSRAAARTRRLRSRKKEAAPIPPRRRRRRHACANDIPCDRLARRRRPRTRKSEGAPEAARRRRVPASRRPSAVRLVLSSRSRMTPTCRTRATRRTKKKKLRHSSRDPPRRRLAQNPLRLRRASRLLRTLPDRYPAASSAMVATPASRSGCAAGDVEQGVDARDTEQASLATRRRARRLHWRPSGAPPPLRPARRSAPCRHAVSARLRLLDARVADGICRRRRGSHHLRQQVLAARAPSRSAARRARGLVDGPRSGARGGRSRRRRW